MIKYQTFNLKNGLKFAATKYPMLESATLHLRGFAGSNMEREGEVGCAHMTEHLLLSSPDVVPYMNRVVERGGKIVGVVSRDDMLFMVKTLKQDYQLGLDLVKAIMGSKLPVEQRGLDKEKEIIKLEYRKSLSKPEKILVRMVYEDLYPSQRISKPNMGDCDDIDGITIEAVRGFHGRLFHPNNFTLSVVADIPEQEVKEGVEKTLGGLIRAENPEKPELKPERPYSVQLVKTTSADLIHARIAIPSARINSPDCEHLEVLASIMDNRLKKAVRHKAGLAYSIGCEYYTTYSYGMLSIFFTTSPEKSEKAIELVKEEMLRIKETIDENEAAIAKIRCVTRFAFDTEKPSAYGDFISDRLLKTSDWS